MSRFGELIGISQPKVTVQTSPKVVEEQKIQPVAEPVEDVKVEEKSPFLSSFKKSKRFKSAEKE